MAYRNFNKARSQEEPLVFDYGEARIKTKARIPFMTILELMDLMEAMEDEKRQEELDEVAMFRQIVGLFQDLLGKEGFERLKAEKPDLRDMMDIVTWIMRESMGGLDDGNPTMEGEEDSRSPSTTFAGAGASSKQTSGAFTLSPSKRLEN